MKQTLQEQALQFLKTRSNKDFAKLYARLKPNLKKTIQNSISGNGVDDAEDVYQSVMTDAYNSLDSYDEDKGYFSTWIYWIAKTHINNFNNNKDTKNLSYFVELEVDESMYELNSSVTYVDAEYDTNEQYKNFEMKVINELGKMKPLHRACFVDKIIYNLSENEIANKYSITKSVVKNNIHRSRKMLRENLHEYVY